MLYSPLYVGGVRTLVVFSIDERAAEALECEVEVMAAARLRTNETGVHRNGLQTQYFDEDKTQSR